MIANKVNAAAKNVVNMEKINSAVTPITEAKSNADPLVIWPVKTGRDDVLAINLSESLSITILKVFALPAAKVPPINVARVIESSGMPPAAKNNAGTVVTSKTSTTLNFINEM